MVIKNMFCLVCLSCYNHFTGITIKELWNSYFPSTTSWDFMYWLLIAFPYCNVCVDMSGHREVWAPECDSEWWAGWLYTLKVYCINLQVSALLLSTSLEIEWVASNRTSTFQQLFSDIAHRYIIFYVRRIRESIPYRCFCCEPHFRQVQTVWSV
jgi:hypothetical protein